MHDDRIIRPGTFGVDLPMDSQRQVFDRHNTALIHRGIAVDAIFIGDSITSSWTLEAFFRPTSGVLLNRGIGGDRCAWVRRRFAADVLQLRPRLVVLAAGVNDTWDLDITWDLALRRDAAFVEREIVADLRAMATGAAAQGIAVALCSILPTNLPGSPSARERNLLIARVNAGLRAAAADRIVFVDYHGRVVAADGLTLRPDLAADGVHPGLTCYALMATALLTDLEAAGITPLAPQLSAPCGPDSAAE